MKLFKACIALAAFAAIFVVPSMASASITLTHPTGSLYNGLVQATNVAHSNTPTQTVMTTSVGNLVCGTATLTGEITKNDGAGIEGNITTAEFAGTHEKSTTGHCQGTGVLGEKITVTPSHTTNPCHTPAGGSQHCSLPWCVKAGVEDTLTVRGGKCSEAARPITFTLHGALTCSYEKASVTGTYTTHAAAAIATIQNQEFTRNTTSSVFCPVGKLDMAFTLETDGASPTDVYIDK